MVNKGDTVVLKPTSLDVTHGFLLDGYPVEAILKQQGLTFLKYNWQDENGNLQTDWDKVTEIEFTAEKSGKFSIGYDRCDWLNDLDKIVRRIKPVSTTNHYFIKEVLDTKFRSMGYIKIGRSYLNEVETPYFSLKFYKKRLRHE